MKKTLTKHKKHSSGVAYAKEDERCPLTDIGCMITSENIFANIQKSGKVSERKPQTLMATSTTANIIQPKFV